MNLIRKLAVVWLGSLLIAPQMVSADILPITHEQLSQHENAHSGGGACVTSGSYDADTFLWQESQTCHRQPLSVIGAGGTTQLELLSEQTTLTAFVDNDGNLLGGSFSWFAQIPEFGMSAPELLGFGHVIDILHVSGELKRNSPDIVGETNTVLTLIEMDFIHDLLGNIGPLVLWIPFDQWVWPGCFDDFLPENTCDPWSTSIGDGYDYTGTNFWYLDRGILVPEPGTLALLGIGLAAMGFARCRRKV